MKTLFKMVGQPLPWLGLCCALCCSGCLAQHGFDFGFLLGPSENIHLTKEYNIRKVLPLAANDIILLLPPLGAIPKSNQAEFQQTMLQAAQLYFHAKVIDLQAQGNLKEYLNEENLVPVAGIIDFQEVSRLGRLLGASYALCTWIRDLRLYPPQVVAVNLTIVDVASGRNIGELEGVFDASEQHVLIELRNYLQSRSSRKFDRTNLDIMLRSPSEYHTFVANYCSRALAEALWPK